MTSYPRPVTDEPVRGVVAPPWIFNVPGLERVRLWTRRLIPTTPFSRLSGFGIGHVSTGSVTGFLRASGHLIMVPWYNMTPLYAEALYACASTALDAGFYPEPITMSSQYFRPPRPQPGNFLARARVVNASSVFVSCSAELEDPLGRLVGHVLSQWRIQTVEPPPPAAPASIEPIEEAVYATPDPPDRPTVGSVPPPEVVNKFSGLEVSRMIMAGELPPIPLMHTVGARWMSAEEGETVITMPASPWFSSATNDLSPGGVETLTNIATATASATAWAPGQSSAVLEMSTRFLRPVRADGRTLTARGRVAHRVDDKLLVESEATDEDGNVFAVQSVVVVLLDRRERRPVEPERVLATLLFTDIVDSTQHAERLGDSAWRALLGEHHALVRRELGAHRGREVNTTGDGFLARFDSPAAAISAAKAIRQGVRQHHLEVRAGIHIGECEVHGNDLAGIAVHAASRIVSIAGPSEIVVSQTVRDVAAGSGLRFAVLGAHTLKGIDGDWNLFVVED